VVIRTRLDDHPGTWMFHCHILEHAERGMMGMLEVVELHQTPWGSSQAFVYCFCRRA
jgi:hypothetical protein